MLSECVHSRHLYLTNSGISAFYIILQALKKESQKSEVIVPAYTASTLVDAIRKAGLKPVLCDISLDDFNIDTESLPGIITSRTLCVVCVHMFGIPVKNIEKLRHSLPDGIFLIEDCAQAMGSVIGSKPVGTFSDAGIFSFNRGKNLPTCEGGCLFTSSDELSTGVESIMNGLRPAAFAQQVSLFVKLLSLAIAFKPSFYSVLYPLISVMKENRSAPDFTLAHYTSVQTALGIALLKKFNASCARRYRNGMALIDGVKNIDGILLPRIPRGVLPAFNRLPILFRDLKERAHVEMTLRDAGIESSRMYGRPLHHLFPLDYKKDDLPNSVYFAHHLLTLPVHPLVTEGHLSRMINTIAKT
ncbi:MAG: DegT/DnrJ/EryC1/StrS family aminotransferase [Nitrospiraceae bacterium]|nr:MAG: DegT/DnrJ/EryC1/StrS family aminotransferase [Nitrospiraceae bacterium]